jgi:hypothetical protein
MHRKVVQIKFVRIIKLFDLCLKTYAVYFTYSFMRVQKQLSNSLTKDFHRTSE